MNTEICNFVNLLDRKIYVDEWFKVQWHNIQKEHVLCSYNQFHVEVRWIWIYHLICRTKLYCASWKCSLHSFRGKRDFICRHCRPHRPVPHCVEQVQQTYQPLQSCFLSPCHNTMPATSLLVGCTMAVICSWEGSEAFVSAVNAVIVTNATHSRVRWTSNGKQTMSWMYCQRSYLKIKQARRVRFDLPPQKKRWSTNKLMNASLLVLVSNWMSSDFRHYGVERLNE